MSVYSQRISMLESKRSMARDLETRIANMSERLADMQQQYVVYLEAQQLLSAVSDANANAILDYVTGIVNKTLGELFPHDSRKVFIEKSMYQGQYAHINIKLTGTNGRTRSLTLQTGTGVRQVVSFLFVLSLIEIRKGRRLMIMDEILSGLHATAKSIVMDIMSLFAQTGFQFVMCEYGADTTGKIYLVEKPDSTSTVTPLDGKYENQIFVFNRPAEDVDLSLRVEEGYDSE